MSGKHLEQTDASELLELGLTFKDAYLCYPFDSETAALRYRPNNKIFALFISHGDVRYLNLKCEPLQADFWRGLYEGVFPGYHMNKLHWNSVLLPSALPKSVLQEMMSHSYSLVAAQGRRHAKNSRPRKL